MKAIHFIVCAFLAFSFTACAQTTKKEQNSNVNETKIKTDKMNTELLTNPTVKKAIEALDANNINAWYALFTNDVVFTDDGNKKDFKPFFDNAFNHKERFLSFDKVENEGKDIYGKFFAGQWGTFNTYFKFHQNSDGKFDRLDIGQVSKL